MIKRTLTAICLLATIGAYAQRIDATVDVKKVGVAIPSTMYGIFFEDINFGADGGLYAELIKNRSFEFEQSLMGWTTFGSVNVLTENACFDKNPHYVRLDNTKVSLAGTGLQNEGFFGVGLKAGEDYNFSAFVRNNSSKPATILVELVSDNVIVATKTIEIKSEKWEKVKATLTPSVTNKKALVRVTLKSNSIVDMDHISMFPADTWKGRENGLRKDLAQALYDLKPGVFRFPGGCIVEGTTLDTRYNWKNSVGPVENRPININRWNYTFPHRKFPDYYQSYGMGFYELFLLSEDMGSEPVPIVSCGLACQFENAPDTKENVPLDQLDPYIQDALDLIEFANGPTTSKWGKVRADMGHPAPFNLKYIGVGNEQWGTLFTERLELFVKAIRAKYPNIKIIGSSGPYRGGEWFDHLWPEMKRLKVDLVDEHYYASPDFFYQNAKRYDDYDRKGPKVFAGEYAAHHKSRENNFDAALSEASFMTGLERNADVVEMATYAPLFAHVEGWQWRPDLIWFDNLNMMKTPSYYVQQLYGHNAGTNLLALTSNGKPLTGDEGIYASAVLDKKTNELVIKVSNTNYSPRYFTVEIQGAKINATAKVVTLQSELEVFNTICSPDKVTPKEGQLKVENSMIKMNLDKYSFTVLRVKL